MFIQYLITFIIAFLCGKYIKFNKVVKNPQPKSKYHNCKILQTEGGRFAPMVNRNYIFITVAGSAVYHNSMCNYNTFSTYEEAKEFLDKWLDMKAVSSKLLNVE